MLVVVVFVVLIELFHVMFLWCSNICVRCSHAQKRTALHTCAKQKRTISEHYSFKLSFCFIFRFCVALFDFLDLLDGFVVWLFVDVLNLFCVFASAWNSLNDVDVLSFVVISKLWCLFMCFVVLDDLHKVLICCSVVFMLFTASFHAFSCSCGLCDFLMNVL